MLLLLSCSPDYGLHYEIIEYEIVEEVNQIIIIEDTSPDYQDVWVDSFTQPGAINGVDIIWVIDPSGSMNSYQAAVLNGIDTMMNALPPQGWRLNIIPSDRRRSETLQLFPLLPGDTPEMAEAMYQQAMLGTYEAGFDALYAYMNINSYSSTWMRNDAAILTVFVSDEEEQSQTYFSNTSSFLSWYSNLRQYAYVSSVVNLPASETVCPGTHNPNYVGYEYMLTANYFNGSIIDICSTDWSNGVLAASNQITPLEYYDLTKTPLETNYIYVFVNGEYYYDWYYQQNENRIYFSILPEGSALVEIAYYIQ